MSRVRGVSIAFGAAFGFLLSWGQLTSPDVIHAMLALENAYVYLIMASGMAVGFVGLRLLRRANFRAVLTGKPISWSVERPQRHHVVGSMLFGVGWAISDACPGPVVAQVGQGFGWSIFTAAGVIGGVLVYLRVQDSVSEPAPPTGGLAYASPPE